MATTDLFSKENGSEEKTGENAGSRAPDISGGDPRRGHIQKTLARNRKAFIEYNEFRKQVFSELSPPKDGETILHLLPWLLSVNAPECPGYIEEDVSFRVHHIDRVRGIRKREKAFKKMLRVKTPGALLKGGASSRAIEGVYTIGGSGGVEQNSTLARDIWIIYDGNDLDEIARLQLARKVNLIRDWMDLNLGIPVYFFLSDVASIKECRFGGLSDAREDSMRWTILKEEFYRTCMVICGKIPLWWLCHDKKARFSYQEAAAALEEKDFPVRGVIDLGDIEKIEKKEYFDAALWQLHKALSNPLNSLLKLSLLKMHLESPDEERTRRDFRETVLNTRRPVLFPDPGVFVMGRIADAHREKHVEARLMFLVECLYLECEINPYSKRQKLKNKLARKFFRRFGMSGKKQNRLRNYNDWDLKSRMKLGDALFKWLHRVYKEISANVAGAPRGSDDKDLIILDRRMSVYRLIKGNKVPVLLKPRPSSEIFNLELRLDDGVWGLFSENDANAPITSNKDVIYTIAFIVWNDLFNRDAIHMKFNTSNITLQEIINLATKMQNFLGTHATLDLDYSNYIKTEHITRMLVVVGMEKPPWPDESVDFGVVCMNCWGELFVHRFDSTGAFEDFLIRVGGENENIETSYYIKRSATSYEKIIERTMMLLKSSIESRI
ncbi:MAG: hypothetical protein GY859_08510 [Desulfobacterales bacterium]|nr:hypothetical protein [Desulfobacterales bacterium]